MAATRKNDLAHCHRGCRGQKPTQSRQRRTGRAVDSHLRKRPSLPILSVPSNSTHRTMRHGSPHPIKPIQQPAVVVVFVPQAEDGQSDQRCHKTSHLVFPFALAPKFPAVVRGFVEPDQSLARFQTDKSLFCSPNSGRPTGRE
jgi:hypothetical protein